MRQTIPHEHCLSGLAETAAKRKYPSPSSAKHANAPLPTRTIHQPNWLLLYFHDTKNLARNVPRLPYVWIDRFHSHCLVEPMIAYDFAQFDAVENTSAVEEYPQRVQPK